MTGSWHLLSDDAEERRRFGDLTSTLSQDGTPAGPRNRLRHVQRIEATDHQRNARTVWYLKVFARTQWKNRLRFWFTAPRASSDAEREYRVTAALHAAGYGAPQPVAWGTDGARSFYVCRALPGVAFADLLASGTAHPGAARAVANHCGKLLRAGYELPDLSADHVFVTGEPGAWQCAVLDLHNGGLGQPGPPSRRLLVRVMRRFARSVRLLPVRWPPALRFAVQLLRAAGCGASARSVLRALPPFATAARYEVSGRSAIYAARNQNRDAREQELLLRVWPGRPGETVLDLPCGTGRLLRSLRSRGHLVVHADGAIAMLQQARTDALANATAAAPAVAADALAMPFADGAVDGVVMFRFLHHLPAENRKMALAEACRVSRRFVLVTFFHPCSFHHLRRRWRQVRGGTPTRFAVSLGALRRDFACHGFALQARAAELPFARDLWLAVFVRPGV